MAGREQAAAECNADYQLDGDRATWLALCTLDYKRHKYGVMDGVCIFMRDTVKRRREVLRADCSPKL